MKNDPKMWRAPDTSTPSERLVKSVSQEMSLLWFCVRDVTIELERAEWWAKKASGTTSLEQALEAANAAAKCQWRCHNILGAARAGYDVIAKLFGELAVGEEAKLVLSHARELGELIRLRADRAQLEAAAAHEAERKLAAEAAKRQRATTSTEVRS